MHASLPPAVLAALLRDAEEADAESVTLAGTGDGDAIDRFEADHLAGFAAGIRHALRILNDNHPSL